jgi:hypothetical protein
LSYIEPSDQEMEMAQPNQTTGRSPPDSNVEQVRADIDSGRTGDKVAYPDPAAAPLGADDEAANAPRRDTSATRQAAHASERQQAEARSGTPAGNPGARSRTWIYVAVAIAAVVIILLLGTVMPDRPQ